MWCTALYEFVAAAVHALVSAVCGALSCGTPLVPQAQRAPQCRRSKPLHPFPGLLPGLAAGKIAEVVAASTTEGRSDGGLARKKSHRYSRGVLTYPQGKPLKPS